MENETVELTFRVREHDVETLRTKVAKINRRAIKLGVDPVAVEEVGRTFSKPHVNGCGEWRPGFWIVEFKASGEAPKLPGWSLVARLEHDPVIGTLVHAVPGRAVPKQFREGKPVCDHCQTRRVRKDTFVVFNEAEGFKRVGRNCIVDFLGGQSAEDVLRRLSWFADWTADLGALDFDEESSDEEWSNDPRFDHFDLEVLLTKVVRVIHADGWCSRGEARESCKIATVDWAITLLTARNLKLTEEDVQRFRATEQDKEDAQAAIEWAAGLPGESDFEHNISKIAQAGITSMRSIGMAGAIPAAHARHLEREVKRKFERDRTLDEHLGTVGEKIERTLTILAIRPMESQWGVTTLFSFRDEDGRQVAWFSSIDRIDEKFQVGQDVSVKATVKKHGEFRGVRQTMITRAKLA